MSELKDPETITKKELVNRIAEDTGLKKVVVKDVLQHFLDEIITELSRGNRLEFREFGVFEVRMRAERMAQNPRTLEKVFVPARKVVKFKVGRMMRDRVGDDEEEEPPVVETPVQKPKKPRSSPPSPPPAPPPSNSNSPF